MHEPVSAQQRDHLTITVQYDQERAAYVAEVDAPVERPDPFTGVPGLCAMDCEGHTPVLAALSLRRALRACGACAPTRLRAAI